MAAIVATFTGAFCWLNSLLAWPCYRSGCRRLRGVHVWIYRQRKQNKKQHKLVINRRKRSGIIHEYNDLLFLLPLAMAAATFIIRFSVIGMAGKFEMSECFKKTLRFVPVTVLPAII
ncbi:AzlD domain-containing protein, partial [Vibrio lentus]|nr:AzlD domain-containing protein [Vibrio lentus]